MGEGEGGEDLWSPVGDALQDPVDGGRVQGQVLGHLHPLDHQLVLDALAADLPEGGEQVEEVPVQAVLQVRRHLHAQLDAGGKKKVSAGGTRRFQVHFIQFECTLHNKSTAETRRQQEVVTGKRETNVSVHLNLTFKTSFSTFIHLA